MDGLVLVLAIILNPRSKNLKAVQRGEQKSRAGASISNGSGDDGSGTRRTAVRAMPASGGHDDKKKSAEEDHVTPITA
jgi:hypothetical protein